MVRSLMIYYRHPDYWTVNTRLEARKIRHKVPRAEIKAHFIALYEQRTGATPSRYLPPYISRHNRLPEGGYEPQCEHKRVDILDDAIDAFAPKKGARA